MLLQFKHIIKNEYEPLKKEILSNDRYNIIYYLNLFEYRINKNSELVTMFKSRKNNIKIHVSDIYLNSFTIVIYANEPLQGKNLKEFKNLLLILLHYNMFLKINNTGFYRSLKESIEYIQELKKSDFI